MEKRIRMMVGVVVVVAGLAAVIPFILGPRDDYEVLGTVGATGLHHFKGGRAGVLVNVIAEPVVPVQSFGVAGVMMIRSHDSNFEQSLALSGFARGLVKTNWFYLRPSPINCPSGENFEFTVEVKEEVAVPFRLLLRYRRYQLPWW